MRCPTESRRRPASTAVSALPFPAVKPSVAPGLVVVDKPDGMTSHDVVARVRRILGTRKVGHAGTLDPMATGVLVLGIERATKLLGHLALDSKAYLATIVLGAATTTDDAEGEVLSTVDASGVEDDAVAAEVAKLTGPIQQVPSAVSAVKIDGKRAYARVRAGEQVDIPARPVTVHRFDVLVTRREDKTVLLDVMVECSSGTYVRALARDLGAALGVGGHLGALRRTRVGPFDLRVARTLGHLRSVRPGRPRHRARQGRGRPGQACRGAEPGRLRRRGGAAPSGSRRRPSPCRTCPRDPPGWWGRPPWRPSRVAGVNA